MFRVSQEVELDELASPRRASACVELLLPFFPTCVSYPRCPVMASLLTVTSQVITFGGCVRPGLFLSPSPPNELKILDLPGLEVGRNFSSLS
jgi:hypothetical protein